VLASNIWSSGIEFKQVDMRFCWVLHVVWASQKMDALQLAGTL